MKIAVQFFGYVAERAGRSNMEIEAEPTVGAVVDAVKRSIPALANLDGSVRFAVNTDYADRSAGLKTGDVVSFLPPVGGG